MNTFKICFLSSEVAPFAGSGELANMSYALPVALKSMSQDIRLMMPKYKSINERKYVLREVIRLREVKVELGGSTKFANGKTAFLPNSKVHVYFLSIPDYFDRKGVYSDPQTGKVYPDNAQRFANFLISVMETLKLLYWQPDIIHCNDWTTALIPFYLKNLYKNDDFFQNTRTVLTIHDFAEQGVFPLNLAREIGIDEKYIQPGEACEFNGKLNLLKAGILYADALNTTSPQLMKEVLSNPEAAHGLQDILAKRQKDMAGILNGLDYDTWNPENDEEIVLPYDVKTVSNKLENKKAFCSEFECDDSLPLIVAIVDVNNKTQLDTIGKVIAELAKDSVQLVIVSNEESKYYAQLEKLSKKHAKFVILRPRIDTRLSHLMWAGADILFLPFPEVSGTKPLLLGMRYGAVPVVTSAGAVIDILKPFDAQTGKGTGFAIQQEKPEAILAALHEALTVLRDTKTWSKVQKSGMKADFSWESSAKKYLKLYEKASKKKR